MSSAFIGRRKELEWFSAALQNFAEDKPHIAFIYDAALKTEDKGGIGKSKLLYEFISIAKSPKFEKNFIVIDEVFDFYEPVNRDQLSRVSRIAQLLEEKTQIKIFDKFWEIIKDYYAKKVLRERVMEEYYAGYNELCRKTNKKVVRFFDTFELAEKTLNYLKEPYRFIEKQVLDNSFIIISGRNQPELEAPIWEGFKEQTLLFPLEGFSDREAQDYFASVGHNNLPLKDIVELNKKAGGRPILLALIADYLKHILKIEDILELEEKDFKDRLVSFIKAYRNPPIEQAILAMAHLKRWCNAKFLRHFVEPSENFDNNYALLKSLSFVRPLGTKEEYVVLHDEMQKMVSAFILEKEDADGSLRREISEWAIKFYDDEINTLREKEAQYAAQKELSKSQVTRDERFALKAEQWFHRLFVGKAKADDVDLYFFDLFDPSLEKGYLDYCFILLSHLEDLDRLLELPVRIKNRIRLRAARLNTEKYQFTSTQYYYDEAQKLFDDLLKEANERDEKAFLGVMLCDYATLKFYSRELTEAEKLLRDSVKALEEETMQQQHGHDLPYFLGKSQNWLGYILYSQGRFAESIKVLEAAERNLFKADRLVIDDPKIFDGLRQLRREQIEGWIAQIRGNLCRIYRETGDTKKSIYYGESSLSRRRKLENLREVVKGLNSLGLIYSRKGDIVKALELFDEAEGHLQDIFDPILKGRILTNKATLLFKRDQFSDLLTHHRRKTLRAVKQNLGVEQAAIDKARVRLNSVIKSLLPTNAREIATAHHNLGELNLMEEKYDAAITSFNDAIAIAQIEKDTYTLLNSRQRLVLAAYLKNDEPLFQKFSLEFSTAMRELKEREETARYVIRYYITCGNCHYDKLFNGANVQNFDENFRTAFQSYMDAIVYARSYAESSFEMAQEVCAERIFELLKGQGIPEHLHGWLLNAWQARGLKPDDLQNYLNF